ncbi:hypothetical protein J6TS7_52590 [Paenibacillus dendritiformis]|nr:hypothetical protein J6TS7_52590 [Paenibacillus dendritiformis]
MQPCIDTATAESALWADSSLYIKKLEYTNPMLQAVWKNQYIANVQITASETVGVEERASALVRRYSRG